jgi:hypothetical protein
VIAVCLLQLALIAALLLYIREREQFNSREYSASQIRWLETLQDRQREIAALTEAYIRSKGDTVILTPPAKRELTASWLSGKPPEAYIRELDKKTK